MIEGQCGMMYLSSEYSSASFNVIHDCYDANTGWDAMGIDIDWNTDHIDVLYNYTVRIRVCNKFNFAWILFSIFVT